MQLMRVIHVSVFTLLTMVLVACGGNNTTTVDLESVDFMAVPSDLDGLVVTLTSIQGGFDAEDVLLDVGFPFCLGERTQWTFVTPNGSSLEIRIDLSIPVGMGAGDYQAAFGAQDADTVGLIASVSEPTGDAATDVENFNDLAFVDVQQGAIRLESVPTAEGEILSGSFQFNLRPTSFETDQAERAEIDLDQEMLVTGAFSVVASADAICS
ncbi:MAG: hypothetical protein AAF846_23785 [Chloroflexota bacterium]